MSYTNPWVGYISRSYQQIKQDLVDKLVIKVPEATDLSETNIVVMLIGMWAGVGEMLNLYIDNMAQEAFVQTARRFSSMVRLTRLIDYRIRAAYPATADVTVVALDSSGIPVATNAPYTIPAFTQFITSSGVKFLNSSAVLIPTGSFGVVVPVKQIFVNVGLPIGVSDGITPSQEFDLGVDYVDGSADVVVGPDNYTEVDTFGFSLATDFHFIVEVREDNHAYLVFGDGINGIIPPAGTVFCSYWQTLGTGGNVDEQTISAATPAVVLPTAGLSSTKIYNQLRASGGLGYENVERLRSSAPLSIRTLDRAVTKQDYEDIARLAPGMGKATVDYECGKRIPIYIVPEGGGIASLPLQTDVLNFMTPKKMLGTFPYVTAAGETRLKINMEVTAKFRADLLLCQADVQNALIDYGAYANQQINRRIRISDIVAKVDNLARVDFLTLTNLGTIPYARPDGHTTQFTWARETLPGATAPADWRIEYDQPNVQVRVFKNLIFQGNYAINSTYDDGTFRFIPQFGAYTNGMSWNFKTYPFLKDIDLNDFTIPYVRLTDLNITMFDQLNPPI
jgi:hypothetical protein